MREEGRWQIKEGGKIRCLVCPHKCLLAPGGRGVCRARKHEPGRGIVPLNYGLLSAAAVDPVEKKPLYHWNPGTSILSLGSVGCNMNCPFCQNWSIAGWETKAPLSAVDPGQVAAMARKYDVSFVAFTYNEPLIWYEFLLDAARLLKKEDLLPVIVSNGQINPGPLAEVVPLIEAANIDLKAFTSEAYEFLGGSFEATKNTIRTLTEGGVHVETTFLLVPGINDDRDAFEAMIKWLASLSPVPVLHISRYFPNRRWTAPATPVALMNEFMGMAKASLPRVYLGNMSEESITECLSCGSVLIRRQNYGTKISGMTPLGQCSVCGAPADIALSEGKGKSL